MPSQVVGDNNTRCRQKRRSSQVPVNDQLKKKKESKKVCLLCLGDEDNEIEFGKIYEKEDLTVHYFCLLLGSGLCQKTKDTDKKSILGFVTNDIRKEIKRGRKLKCCFCHKNGASIGCCIKACKKTFHLCCGRKNETMHQFYGSFRSYCPDHIPVQLVKKASSGVQSSSRSCAICLTQVTEASSSLVSPCCMRSCFHRICLQKYAISAGLHYFKCPLCNDVNQFQREMLEFGIYIPDQDASWEREPNAYMDLLERHDTCDAPQCICPKGNKYDADSGRYELLLCGVCGSFGSHRACGGLLYKEGSMVCHHCAGITDKVINVEQNKDDTSKSQDDFHCHHSTSSPAQNRRHARPRRQLFNDSVMETAGSSYSQSRYCQGYKDEREDPIVKILPSIYNGESMTLEETKLKCFVRLEKIDTEICMSQGEVDLNEISINIYKKMNQPDKHVSDKVAPLIFMGEDFGVLDTDLEGSPVPSPQLSQQTSCHQKSSSSGGLERLCGQTDEEHVSDNMPQLTFMGEDFEVLDSRPEGPPVLSLQTPQQPSCVHKKCSSEGKLLRKLHEKQCMDNLTEVRQNWMNTLLKSPPRGFLKADIPLNNSLSIFQENKNPKSFKKAMIPLLSEQKSLRRNNLASVGSKIRKNINKSQNIPDLKLKQTSILDFFN